MSPRAVVLCSRGKFDVSRAADHGDLCYLVDRLPSPFAVDQIVDQVEAALDRMAFDPEVDYFVLTGNPSQLAVAFGCVLARYRRVKVLLFDASNDGYVPRMVGV